MNKIENNAVIFKYSKFKLLKNLLFFLFLFSISLYLAIYPENFVKKYFRSENFVFIIGNLSIIFSSIFICFTISKIFSNKAALIISDKGIFDNTTIENIGLIKWNEIKNIENNNNSLLINVYNSEKVINRKTNKIVKWSLSSINKKYKTPVVINTGLINIELDELYDIIVSKHKIHKQQKLHTITKLSSCP